MRLKYEPLHISAKWVFLTGDACTSGVLRADGVLSVSVQAAGYLPRVIYHQVYQQYTKKKDLDPALSNLNPKR